MKKWAQVKTKSANAGAFTSLLTPSIVYSNKGHDDENEFQCILIYNLKDESWEETCIRDDQSRRKFEFGRCRSCQENEINSLSINIILM